MSRDVQLHSHPSPIEHWRHVVEIAAFIGAAIWAIYVFVYQERIKPETATPRVQSTFSVETHALKGQRTYVKIHLLMKNAGESVASIAGLNVNVYGVSYGSRVDAYADRPASGIIQTGRSLPPAPDRFLSSFTNEWRAFGTDKTLRLAPGNAFDESFAFALPDKTADSLKIRYVICWTHPTERVWHEPLVREADGSNHFADVAKLYDADAQGLFCTGNRRGEPYSL